MILSKSDRCELLKIARASLVEYFGGEKYRHVNLSEALQQERGAFVTLRKQGSLRGCIGYIQALKPLAEAVADLAVDAAIHDPRFPSMQAEELEEADIEISAMTPIEKIDDVEVIEVGKHGLFLKRGGYSGLLLPQVATEWGWDRKKFLEQTCNKAGISKDAWKDDDTEIYIFSAEVFGEGKHKD